MWVKFFLNVLIVAFLTNVIYGVAPVIGYGQPISFAVMLSALAFGVVAALLAGFLMARGIVKDIRSLIEFVIKVENHEPVDAPTVTRKDELGTLQKTLGRLTHRDKAIQEANEDPLTGLANRRFLMQRIESISKSKAHAAIFFIDLDGFKPVNDKFGHDVGDEALQVVADRLSACIREEDVLARLGGDEFVIVLMNVNNRQVVEQRANKILELVGQPIWINGNRVRLGASIGIALAPEDGDDGEAVLNAADESMYAAKQGGKNQFRFYS